MRLITLALILLLSGTAEAQRIKDLADLAGVRSNQLIGYGLVVGLPGSGDQTTQTPFTVQSLISMLSRLGVTIPAGTSLQLKNVAAVMVTATLPPFSQPGQHIDVTVASVGNAKSIKGGTLLMTPLKGADGAIYAMAQGEVLVAVADGAAGNSDAGRIPRGATVERNVATRFGEDDQIRLELKQADFTTALRVEQGINQQLPAQPARAVDARTIRVKLPPEAEKRVAFLARLENIRVTPDQAPARVIINARSGSIIMNQQIRVRACAIAHGGLSLNVRPPGEAGEGRPDTRDAGLVHLAEGADLKEVVKALNAVGASPQDLLAILQGMRSAGALDADLEVI